MGKLKEIIRIFYMKMFQLLKELKNLQFSNRNTYKILNIEFSKYLNFCIFDFRIL